MWQAKNVCWPCTLFLCLPTSVFSQPVGNSRSNIVTGNTRTAPAHRRAGWCDSKCEYSRWWRSSSSSSDLMMNEKLERSKCYIKVQGLPRNRWIPIDYEINFVFFFSSNSSQGRKIKWIDNLCIKINFLIHDSPLNPRVSISKSMGLRT